MRLTRAWLTWVAAIIGLLGLKFKWWDKIGAWCRKVNETASAGSVSGASGRIPERPRTSGGDKMRLLADYEHPDDIAPIPAVDLLEPEKRRAISRENSGSIAAALRRTSTGSDEADGGLDFNTDDSLRGVGGRVLKRSDFDMGERSRPRPQGAASGRHRSASGQLGAASWGGPSPFLKPLREDAGTSSEEAWRAEDSPTLGGGTRHGSYEPRRPSRAAQMMGGGSAARSPPDYGSRSESTAAAAADDGEGGGGGGSRGGGTGGGGAGGRSKASAWLAM